MADKFSDWSTTEGNNTTVGDSNVNIAEQCLPGNVNDALRAIMAAAAGSWSDAPGLPTRTAITTTSIPADADFIRTAGYATVGDGGAALYKRVGAEPTHALKVQSADGAWWEIAEPHIITFQACGGVEGDSAGNGAGNVTAFDNFIGYLQDGFSGDDDAKGPTLYFPIIDGSGVYHFNDHLNVKAAVHITGPGGWHWAARDAGPKLVFPADSHGIIIHTDITIDDGTEASSFTAAGSIIENLALKGGGPGETTGHGVWVRVFSTLRHLFVEDFAEDGFHIVGTIGAGGAGEGNVSTTKVENSTADGNGRHGFFWNGSDANAGNNFGNEARSNGHWGFYDSSFLGNTHTGYHERRNGVPGVAGNGGTKSSVVHFNDGTDKRWYAVLGATEAELVATQPGTDDTVWAFLENGGSSSKFLTWTAGQDEGTFFVGGSYATDNANARNVFIGCYTEESAGPPQMDGPTLVLGGHGMDEVVGGAFYIGKTTLPLLKSENNFIFEVLNRLTIKGTSGPQIELEDSGGAKVYVIENGGLELRTDAGNNSVTFQDSGQTAGIASFQVRHTSGNLEDIVHTAYDMNQLRLVDGVTAPSTIAGVAQIYVDTADGDLKVKFGDGTVTVIAAD